MVLKIFGYIAAFAFAGTAMADGRYENFSSPVYPLSANILAQNNFDAMDETDRRRMEFYAERALKTLLEVVNSSETQDIAAQSKINTQFRSAIVRLVDAGQRSGLSSDQVADFFIQTVRETEGQEFLERTANIGGGLDFQTLFRNVSAPANPLNATALDSAAFLEALASASSGLTLTENQTDAATPNAPAQIDGPVALPNANEAERAVVDRVVVRDGVWELTIVQGDSLSEISSALYGDSLSYPVIYNANSTVLTNPNVLEVDTVIVLPKP